MINLLSPATKEQIKYAKFNGAIVRYVRAYVLILVLLATIFGVSWFLIKQQSNLIAADVAQKQKDITKLNSDLAQARLVADRVSSIKTIGASQTHFSALLNDLAGIMPQGVSLDGIALTGDDRKPVRFSVTGNSYESILAFRQAFANTARVDGVDIETLSQTSGVFRANVVIGFKPGQAK